MKTQNRAKYQAPKLEVQRLRDLPSALAQSGCRTTPSKHALSCSTSGTGGQPAHFLSN
ncbi:MAG TPA: hypothetical protein VEU97_07485 [Ktedonobacteraceae bacterium]|jgi:hypothetical protein|nr:hypothetical protein [Ktedonobacteraceae bacterium]